jgi:ATPase family associated with various cellular activities (AAA)
MKTKEDRIRVLVVGDWLLDEHWVLGTHRIASSSRTGLEHSRALHTKTSTVRTLCGAGKVASVLYEAHESCQGPPRFCFDIAGLGIWDKRDGLSLTRALNPRSMSGDTHHSMAPPSDVPKPLRDAEEAILYNLAAATDAVNPGTTCVIRLYKQETSKFTLKERIDWEVRPSKADISKIEASIPKYVKSSLPGEREVDAVVIKDLRKGVVSGPLIDALAKRFPKAAWFVSSKEWEPEWFRKLPGEQVRLLLIPQLAAYMALHNTDKKKFSVRSWLTPSGHVSEDALKAIDHQVEEFHLPNALIVALPDGFGIIARCRAIAKAEKDAVVQTETSDQNRALDLAPMGSIFFPALVAGLLPKSRLVEPPAVGNPDAFQALLKSSLFFTVKWMREELNRFRDPQNWEPGEKQQLLVPPQLPAESFGRWRPFCWQAANAAWGASQYHEMRGVISLAPGQRRYLELSRAMNEVDGYVCCVKDRRDHLRGLVQEIRSFAHQRPRSHRSYMILDSPGSGKSFLAQCLATSLKMRVLEFNITQMISRNDLLDCFDNIATSQAQSPDVPVLVFVDEINAKLDSQHVYDAFLAPIETGKYSRAGRIFHIQPCVWLFAGTEPPVPPSVEDEKEQPGKLDKSDKGSDFESRLSAREFDLQVFQNVKAAHQARLDDKDKVKAAQLERIYVGVELLRSAFRDVRSISPTVLQAFADLPLPLSVREVRRFVKAFQDIQYGEVTARNVPWDWVPNPALRTVEDKRYWDLEEAEWNKTRKQLRERVKEDEREQLVDIDPEDVSEGSRDDQSAAH